MSPRRPKAGTHQETSGAATDKPTAQDCSQLIASIEMVLQQFQTVQRETPEMFWWSIEVAADITQYPDMALAAWAEVLQEGYDLNLLNLGGIGTKDLRRWTLYGAPGHGVTFGDYARAADVCVAAVHALWLSAIVPMRRGAWDGLFVVTKDPQWGGFHAIKATSWAGRSVEEPGQAYRMLWACDQGDFAVSLSDYIDTYPIQYKARKGMSSAPVGGSYWTSIWFESLFRSAPAIGLNVGQGRQPSQYEEIGATGYRCIHESICQASILALQFLRHKVEERLRLLEEVRQSGGTTGKKGKITLKEANIQVRSLLKETPSWEWTVRTLTAKVKEGLGGGSTGLIAKCPAWSAYKEKRDQLRKEGTIKTVSLTSEIEAVLGIGDEDEVLSQLIAEQATEDRDDEKKAKLYLSHEKKPKKQDS